MSVTLMIESLCVIATTFGSLVRSIYEFLI